MLSLLVMAAQAASLTVVVQPEELPEALRSASALQEAPILFHVDADGGLSCRAANQSAPAPLRRSSCEFVARRWPFAANRDKTGQAVPTDVPLTVVWGPPIRKDLPDDYDGATPLSPDRWFTPDDYPAEAMRRNHSGNVKIGYDITAAGHPADCGVVTPAKYEKLTEAACAVLLRRALFLPAIDPAGRARIARAQTWLRFVLGS